ncbi:MAG: vitamin B12-dependent ribonucleotide reductase [Candidatus Sericytochromatia bacterium]|nr:vitamin B12-dependent ribonucleotide reductase [Candidatus Sericytochromatia bacterium]
MLSKNALTVLEKRYLRKDEKGEIAETPLEMFARVASTLAEVDRSYGADEVEVRTSTERFLRVLTTLSFLPNSPTLANAGTRTGQLSACFVLPVPDDLGGIFESIRDAALIHQTGGGTGFSFSRLRPAGDIVGSTKGVSSGPVSFMDVFNAATESIKQGGMRRGANMGILRVDHPDIEVFINHKEDLSKLTNFNISVAATDKFMQAVEAGTSYDLVNPRTGAVTGQRDARTIFRTIVERAHSTGEPGLIFIDRINAEHPTPWLGDIESTNPCGEQPLLPYESCNLGSINLERMLTRAADGAPVVDWDLLRETIHIATHMLDNVIDANRYPIDSIRDMTKTTRKIGLGVMGFARMLCELEVGYHTEEGRRLAEQVMSFIDYESKVASIELARKRGPFPGFRKDNRYALLWQQRQAQVDRHPEADYASLIPLMEQYGIRNACTTTVAPTGTLSIIADTSGGVEPLFALAFRRFQADTHMVDVDQPFRVVAEREGFASEAFFEALEANHGSLLGLEDFSVPEWVREVYVTAHDIRPEDHVLIQAAFQRYNDSATSKTINFSEQASVEDVQTAYALAYRTGCKGITVYRNNSRAFQPLSVPKKEEKVADQSLQAIEPQAPMGVARPSARRRAEDLYGFTRCTATGDGKLYTTINYDEQGIREVFTVVGRSGGTLFSLSEALGRMVSLSLQHGVPVEDIATSLIGIRGANPVGFGRNQVLSIPDALGKVLREAPRSLGPILAGMPAAVTETVDVTVSPVRVSASEAEARMQATLVYGKSPDCPDCGASLEFGEGCATCRSCGYSKCS